jgi:cyclase
MDAIRIMPCLDMKDGRVVKGVHFVDLKDAGDPVQNASFYQAEGADELAMLDIAATLENRKTRLQWVRAVSSVIEIPLTVGGGIGSLEDIDAVLDAGASRVSMNSAAVNDPDLISTAAKRFGGQRITVAIDGRRNDKMPSGFEVVIAGGTKPAGKDAVGWAKTCQELGAGVILPTSMDGDGTQTGYDIEFTPPQQNLWVRMWSRVRQAADFESASRRQTPRGFDKHNPRLLPVVAPGSPTLRAG